MSRCDSYGTLPTCLPHCIIPMTLGLCCTVVLLHYMYSPLLCELNAGSGLCRTCLAANKGVSRSWRRFLPV